MTELQAVAQTASNIESLLPIVAIVGGAAVGWYVYNGFSFGGGGSTPTPPPVTPPVDPNIAIQKDQAFNKVCEGKNAKASGELTNYVTLGDRSFSIAQIQADVNDYVSSCKTLPSGKPTYEYDASVKSLSDLMEETQAAYLGTCSNQFTSIKQWLMEEMTWMSSHGGRRNSGGPVKAAIDAFADSCKDDPDKTAEVAELQQRLDAMLAVPLSRVTNSPDENFCTNLLADILPSLYRYKAQDAYGVTPENPGSAGLWRSVQLDAIKQIQARFGGQFADCTPCMQTTSWVDTPCYINILDSDIFSKGIVMGPTIQDWYPRCGSQRTP